MDSDPKPGVWPASSGNPLDDPATQVASLLFGLLAAACALMLVVAVPFFVRPWWGVSILTVLALSALVGRRMARKGHAVAAMHAFAVIVVLIAIPIMAVSAHLTIPTMVIAMTLPAYATACGASYAYGLIAAYIGAAVAVQLARGAGWSIPILFPAPPVTEIMVAAVGLV